MNEQEPGEFEVCPSKQRITVYDNLGGGISIKCHDDCVNGEQIICIDCKDVPALIRAIRNARRACK